MKKSIITPAIMREINRSAMLEIIQREGPLSRTIIARHLGFSLPTVVRIVEELESQGIIQQSAQTDWSGGRRRPLYQLDTENFRVLSVDLGKPHFYAALLNLSGTILDEMTLPEVHLTKEEALRRVGLLIEALLSSPFAQNRKIAGVGIGIPGVVSPHDGIVLNSESLGWQQINLPWLLQDHFKGPFFIDRDLHFAALGELYYGSGMNSRHFAVLSLGETVEAGIILNRRLFRGSTNCAGKIGRMILHPPAVASNLRSQIDLDAEIAVPALIHQAETQLQPDVFPQKAPHLTLEDLLDAAQSGESWAEPLISNFLDELSLAIVNLSALLNPELIIFCESPRSHSDWVIGQINNRIHPLCPSPPRLQFSHLGRQAVVLGVLPTLFFPNRVGDTDGG